MQSYDRLGSIWRNIAQEGFYAPGDVSSLWVSSESEFPMNTAGVLMRTDSLRTIGGWQGLPSAEDFGMIVSLTNSYSGVIIEEVVYRYRKHHSQSTSREDFKALESIVRKSVYQRSLLRN